MRMRFAIFVAFSLLGSCCAAEPLARRVDPKTGEPMRFEEIAGVEVRYGEVLTEKGWRVRTYTSRPRGAAGRLPLVVFIPWLSCDRVENPRNAHDGWSQMLRIVMRESGAQVARIEKPGVGDSEGPACAQSDLDDDMAAFRAGIRGAMADPGVDPARVYLFGGSNGAAFVPILADGLALRGIVATGGFTRTWLEHMLAIERRRLELSGEPPAAVNAAMRAYGPLCDRLLNGGITPAQALAERPDWKRYWTDGPDGQYGRPMRYYQQLQALDIEGAWQRVDVPVLIVQGELDWITGTEESDRAAAIVARRDKRLVTYVVRPGMNHHFETFPDARAAFQEKGGRFDETAARTISDWLRAH